jgi:hypothetical protein
LEKHCKVSFVSRDLLSIVLHLSSCSSMPFDIDTASIARRQAQPGDVPLFLDDPTPQTSS